MTMPKINFWLIGLVCLLSGIVYGLRVAPWTHCVQIACNNGNNNGNSNASMNGHNEGEEEEEIEE